MRARWKVVVGGLLAVAVLSPAVAEAAENRPPAATAKTCQAVVHQDVPALVTIDVDSAPDGQVRLLAAQVLELAGQESLLVVPEQLQVALKGSMADLRAFFKGGLLKAWTRDLRVKVVGTMDAGPQVNAAAQVVLEDGRADVLLTYLNQGVYLARARDCAI